MAKSQVSLPVDVRKYNLNVAPNEKEVLSRFDLQWTVQCTMGENSQAIFGTIFRFNTGIG